MLSCSPFRPIRAFLPSLLRTMSTAPSLSRTTHIERTATEPRDPNLHQVLISRIDQVNRQIRVVRLSIPAGAPVVKFLPGQWLDVHIPDLPKPGGFTITSPPSLADSGYPPSSSFEDAKVDSSGYVELAIQLPPTPTNPAASHFHSPIPSLLGTPVSVRVGGSFVFPPPEIPVESVKRIVFIAGGVGINPLVAMVSAISETQAGQMEGERAEVRFLYSTKKEDGEEVLFERRLRELFGEGRVRGRLGMWYTRGDDGQIGKKVESGDRAVGEREGRIGEEDVLDALGEGERVGTLVYVCGPPPFTDRFVGVARAARGMSGKRVFCEKWW